MNPSRAFLIQAFLALALPPASPQPPSSGVDKLFSEFQDPPREYTIRPFWFWNGKLEAREVNRQIDEMVSTIIPYGDVGIDCKPEAAPVARAR